MAQKVGKLKLTTSFKEVFDDINKITVGENRVDTELFLGGDYKVRYKQLYFGHYPLLSNFSPNIYYANVPCGIHRVKKIILSFCNLV